MSWNIAKPGDQINGPVAVTGNLNVDSNTLFVDSANNRVGVLTASPTVPLDVVGDAKVSGNLTVDTNTLVVNAANNFVGINTSTPIANLDVRASNGVGAVFLRTTDPSAAVASAYIQTPVSTGHSATSVYGFWYQNTGVANPSAETLAINTNANERLRIASSGNVGIGTATPNRKLEVAAGTGGAALRLTNTNGNSGIEILTASDKTSWRIGAQYNVDQAFEITPSTAVGGTTFSTPAVVVTSSGNVGIGTATPIGKLDIRPDAAFVNACSVAVDTDGSNNPRIRLYRPDGGGSTTAYPIHIKNELGNLNILTGTNTVVGSETVTSKLYLTAGGNLGLGVTPKSWAASYKAFQLGSYSSIQDVSGFTIIGCNYYNDGADKSLNGGAVSRYLQNSGAHTWQRVNSSTANATIAFTDSMVLNDSGNLGLGVTPSAWSGGGFLELQSNRLFAFAGPVGEMLANAFYDGQWKFKTTAATSRYRQDNGSHIWYYSGSGTAGNVVTWTQAMTLFADGNLAIGTASNNGGVCVEDRYILVRSNNAKQFLRLGTDGSNDIYLSGAELLGITGAAGIRFSAGTGLPERLRIKSTGQVNFNGLASDPAGAAAGDVYYNTTTNKLKCYNGTTWNDLF